MHPSSKVAKENLEVFTEMWQCLASDVSTVSKDVMDVVHAMSKPDLNEYLSLPRPGVGYSENYFNSIECYICFLIAGIFFSNVETRYYVKAIKTITA